LTKVADSQDLADKMISLAKDEKARINLSNISHRRIKAFENETFIKKWIRLTDYCLNNA